MTAGGRIGHLGLGSNLGDRRAHLQAAVDELRRHRVEILACSSTYDTEPVGEVLDQPPFLNACVRMRTPLEPTELLDACVVPRRGGTGAAAHASNYELTSRPVRYSAAIPPAIPVTLAGCSVRPRRSRTVGRICWITWRIAPTPAPSRSAATLAL